MSSARSPMAAGAAFALFAALSFGLTTPVVERAGRGVGALWTAALLYAGAYLSSLALRRWSSSGPVMRRADLKRLLVIGVVGAAIAPTLLAWGLQRAGATTGSLLLNLEAVFTVLLARALYREPIGRRVMVALVFMALGGAALTLDAASRAGWSAMGALAIAGATAAWALDNALTRGLAEHEPVRVVAGKSLVGALITAIIAVASGAHRPGAPAAIVLLVCGATGYGLSLRLYLLAQRRIGAARTASIFAIAPFVGAAAAWAIGDKSPGIWTIVSAALFVVGVFLHVTEHHAHRHVHLEIEHEHAHRHDDAHHDHRHDPPIVGEHSHLHQHQRIEHEHDHAPDVHHEHVHE